MPMLKMKVAAFAACAAAATVGASSALADVYTFQGEVASDLYQYGNFEPYVVVEAGTEATVKIDVPNPSEVFLFDGYLGRGYQPSDFTYRDDGYLVVADEDVPADERLTWADFVAGDHMRGYATESGEFQFLRVQAQAYAEFTIGDTTREAETLYTFDPSLVPYRLFDGGITFNLDGVQYGDRRVGSGQTVGSVSISLTSDLLAYSRSGDFTVVTLLEAFRNADFEFAGASYYDDSVIYNDPFGSFAINPVPLPPAALVMATGLPLLLRMRKPRR